jgi:hypothetical protein
MGPLPPPPTIYGGIVLAINVLPLVHAFVRTVRIQRLHDSVFFSLSLSLSCVAQVVFWCCRAQAAKQLLSPSPSHYLVSCRRRNQNKGNHRRVIRDDKRQAAAVYERRRRISFRMQKSCLVICALGPLFPLLLPLSSFFTARFFFVCLCNIYSVV